MRGLSATLSTVPNKKSGKLSVNGTRKNVSVVIKSTNSARLNANKSKKPSRKHGSSHRSRRWSSIRMRRISSCARILSTIARRRSARVKRQQGMRVKRRLMVARRLKRRLRSSCKKVRFRLSNALTRTRCSKGRRKERRSVRVLACFTMRTTPNFN